MGQASQQRGLPVNFMLCGVLVVGAFAPNLGNEQLPDIVSPGNPQAVPGREAAQRVSVFELEGAAHKAACGDLVEAATVIGMYSGLLEAIGRRNQPARVLGAQ